MVKRTITSVKIPENLYEDFKIMSVRSKINLQEIVERTMQVVLEVEARHKTAPKAHFHFLRYFQIPKLRSVLVIKIFKRRANRPFPALAILYRRNGEEMGSVSDVVSFGTCPLQPKAERFLDDNILIPVRSLNTPLFHWPLHTKSPWNQ